jgi:hypothetical protein
MKSRPSRSAKKAARLSFNPQDVRLFQLSAGKYCIFNTSSFQPVRVEGNEEEIQDLYRKILDKDWAGLGNSCVQFLLDNRIIHNAADAKGEAKNQAPAQPPLNVTIELDTYTQDTTAMSKTLARVLAHIRTDGFNIKLDKCGGLTEALLIVQEARRLGLGVMVGNMVGTSLAMAPAFIVGQHCDVVDLDGPTFLTHDRTPSCEYRDGTIWCANDVWGSRLAA